MAGVLSTLTFSDATPLRITDKTTLVRNRFVDALKIQIGITEAMTRQETYVVKRPRLITDPTTGQKVKRDMPIRIRAWMFQDQDKKWSTRLLYGNKPIFLMKDKGAIFGGSLEDLIAVYNKLIEATLAGELDKVLIAASKRPARKAQNVG